MNGYVQNTKSKKNIRVLSLFLISLIFVGIAVSIAVVCCNYIGNRNFKETFHSASSLKVNNKIRVVQISDLHNCIYGKENNKLIDRVEKLKPDLIIYTGDIIDSKTESNERVLSLCNVLSKVAPSYYIYGNNEVEKCYDNPFTKDSIDERFGFNDNNRDPSVLLAVNDEFATELEEAGVKVLKNKADTITIGTTQVDIYGVLTSNPSAFWPYAGESFGEYLYSNKNNFKLTVIHQPIIFTEFTQDYWGDLMLAGDTHGGGIRIPFLGPLYTHDAGFFPEKNGYYAYGRFEVSGRPLIVSSGLENKDIFRINNEPEIVIVDINKF